MPKDRRETFHQAMVSPYARGLKISDRKSSDVSPPVGDIKEWEETRCPICLDHPHNAVLLLCSSRNKGCHPFICDTSYRLSNCLDQFRMSSEKQQSDLVCPLCRGAVTSWVVKEPARKFMNSKTRCCSLETCDFSGNYAELRKHARLEHPSDRPSEISSTRNSNWTSLVQQMDLDDALAHQLGGVEVDWEQEDLLSGESFFDFSSGMSDFEDGSDNDFFGTGGLVWPSLDSPDLEWEMSLFGRSSSSSSRSSNEEGNHLTSLRAGSSNRRENDLTISWSRSSYDRDIGATNLSSRSSDQEANALPRLRSVSRNRRENDLTISRPRSSYEREIGATNLSSRSSNRRENVSIISSSISSNRMENGQPRSRRSATRHFQR